MKGFCLAVVALVGLCFASDAHAQGCRVGRSSGCGVSQGCNVGSSGCNVGSSSGCNVSRSVPAAALVPAPAASTPDLSSLLQQQTSRAPKPKRIQFDPASAVAFWTPEKVDAKPSGNFMLAAFAKK